MQDGQERHSFDRRYTTVADAKAHGSLTMPLSVRSGTIVSSVSRATTEKLAMLEESVPL